MWVLMLASAGLAAGTGAGCQRPALPNPMPIEPTSYEPVYEASVEVLTNAGFEVVRRDYRFGLVTTEPKTSPTVFEFWVRDNTTLSQKIQSTVSDLRRSVRIELAPLEGDDPAAAPERADREDRAGAPEATRPAADGPRGYAVRVEVTQQRQQVPVRRLTGAVETGVFSRLAAVPGEWAARGISGSYWEPIGRDHHLEQRLLRRIARRASLEDPPTDPATDLAPAEADAESASAESQPRHPGDGESAPGATPRTGGGLAGLAGPRALSGAWKFRN